jgi:hypothetical protein
MRQMNAIIISEFRAAKLYPNRFRIVSIEGKKRFPLKEDFKEITIV